VAWKLLESIGTQTRVQSRNYFIPLGEEIAFTDGNCKTSYLPRHFLCSFNIGNEITAKGSVVPYIFQMVQTLLLSLLTQTSAFSTSFNFTSEKKNTQISLCLQNNKSIQVKNCLEIKYDLMYFRKIWWMPSIKWGILLLYCLVRIN
jgi:hypothetical protein